MAKSRQLRVISLCEYVNATDKGVQIPVQGSFSYAVTDKGIGELASLIYEHAVSRGSENVPRVQCIADGEERILHIVLPHRGRYKNPRGTTVQAGRYALATSQRGMRLRPHREAQERSVKCLTISTD